jgi:hypothetical protein
VAFLAFIVEKRGGCFGNACKLLPLLPLPLLPLLLPLLLPVRAAHVRGGALSPVTERRLFLAILPALCTDTI